jgi:short-subunit dehydrogenase
MNTPLRGKRIWLVGSSFGIGEALAEQLGALGATLVLSGRTLEKLEAIAKRIGNGAEAIACDVTDVGSVRLAHQLAGVADMVIYNAGTYEPMSAADFDLAAVEQMVDVNLMGAVRVLHTVLPALRARGSGAIALVGSVAGYRGLPKAMGYGFSKAALIHLAENLRQDLDGSGIAVHLINPGFVKTRMTDKNSFAMPFMITAEQAAARIVQGLEKGEYEIHFPRRLTWPMKLIALLPARAYFWLSKRVL